MKVLFVKRNLDRSEVDLVLQLKQQGVYIRVLTVSGAPDNELLKAEGVYIEAKPYDYKISLHLIRQIRQLLNQHAFDIIHATDSKSLSNAIWASYFKPVKIVGYRGTLATIRRFDLSYWLGILHPRVDRVICVNQSTRDYLLNFLSPEKLLVNYKGYDIAWGEEVARQEAALPQMPEDAFVVCYIANTQGRPYKGLETLVHAMHLVRERDIHLLFIGNYDEPVKALAKNGSAADRIHFLGVRHSAASFLRYAKIFVLPSSRDGLPRVMKEAMAQGVAVITTRIVGPTELVIDGESGLWVEPDSPAAIAESISRLYHNPVLRNALGQAGKQRLADHFSSTSFIAKTLALYRELLADNND